MSRPGQVKAWILVAPTKSGVGRPEIVMGHLVTEAEAVRMVPDFEDYPGTRPARVAVRYRCNRCHHVQRVRGACRRRWECQGKAVRS